MKRGRNHIPDDINAPVVTGTVLPSHPYVVASSLIDDSLRRCEESGFITRITVSITRIVSTNSFVRETSSPCQHFRLSVADTGRGISPDQIQTYFPFRKSYAAASLSSSHVLKSDIDWDGVVAIITTGMEDFYIRHYKIHEGEIQALGIKDLFLPEIEQTQKSGTPCSGTETSVSFRGDAAPFEVYVQKLCRKISILNLKQVFIEVLIGETNATFSEDDRLLEERCEVICDGDNESTESRSSIDRLEIGCKDYAYRYFEIGPELHTIKVGKGQSIFTSSSNRGASWTMHACLLVVESLQDKKEDASPSPVQHMPASETEIHFFENFRYCPEIPGQTLDLVSKRANRRVAWSKFEFVVNRAETRVFNEFPLNCIIWDKLPQRIARMDLVLHRFRNDPAQARSNATPKWLGEIKATKTAIEAALHDFKINSPHLLSSKVQRNVSDLSRSISDIVSKSSNGEFQRECANILGLPSIDSDGLDQHLNDTLLDALLQRPERTRPQHVDQTRSRALCQLCTP